MTSKRAVISGYYGFKNFGDETILSILIKHLRELGIDITVFSNDTKYTTNIHKVKSADSFNLKNVIYEIQNCDIFISGGGSLLQDATSLKSLLYYAFLISIAQIFNKKIIIFAQGIGPLKHKLSQIIVKNLFKYCSYISVRDEKSFDMLKNWDIKSDLVCDPVFSLDIKPTDKTNSAGIQLRDFKNITYDFLQKLALFINAKFKDYKIEIFSLQDSLDMQISQKFEEILKNINPNIETEIINDNIIERISSLKYFVAMRYHAILAALKTGVKTCAINYDIKVENLAKSTGIPIINLNENVNFERIYQLLQNTDAEKISNLVNSQTFDWSEFDNIIQLA